MNGKIRKQKGAALILAVTVMIVGVLWFTVGALGKAAPSTADREVRTGKALMEAKRALLAYVALRAADASENNPGRLPCPESLDMIGTDSEGTAAPSPGFATCGGTGRLPWRTLGIDQPRDGHGEPLWYVTTPGTWSLINSGTALVINPSTLGMLQVDGQSNAAAALIIAPGVPLNTLAEPGTPAAPCARVNQQVLLRSTSPLAPANFLECANAAGGNYSTVSSTPWSNDRVIVVTAAEIMDAIQGAVADRLQRTVAPALANWDQTEFSSRGRSWSVSHSLPYLPFASTFTNPATNDLLGNTGVREGMLPIATNAPTNWTGNVTSVLGLTSFGCFDGGTALRCLFVNFLSIPPFSARIAATANDVASSFRSTIVASNVSIIDFLTSAPVAGASATLSMGLSATTGRATATIDLNLPPVLPLVVEAQIPHLQDAAVLSASNIAWFRGNQWERFTYYAVAPSATASPTAVCNAAGDAGCLEARGLPTSTGSYWNKRLVLVLAGRPLSGQSRLCTDTLDANGAAGPNGIPDCQELVNYFEEENRSPGNRIYRADLRVPTPIGATAPFAPFNDHLAACPFQHTPTSGGPVTLCN